MTTSVKDVARAAGVSPATVSRALGKGPISEALRAQVLEAVRTTGYRPNLAARRLRSQDSGTIGLIVADIGNPFFTGVAKAVEEAAYQAGLRVILCNTDEDPAREAIYLRLMQEERVTGLILAPTRTTADRLATQPLEVPTVLIDRAGPPGRFDCVLLDNEAASAALVDHLVAQGHRRIAGLFGSFAPAATPLHPPPALPWVFLLLILLGLSVTALWARWDGSSGRSLTASSSAILAGREVRTVRVGPTELRGELVVADPHGGPCPSAPRVWAWSTTRTVPVARPLSRRRSVRGRVGGVAAAGARGRGPRSWRCRPQPSGCC